MQSERILKLMLMAVSLILSLNFNSSAQSARQGTDRVKNFGWSLKKFDKKEEVITSKKSNKQKPQDNSQSNKREENIQNKERNSEAPPNEDIIRVETNLVINDVLVVNDKGMAVTNLKRDDFIITEDGIKQKAELFSFGDNAALPRSIVLIFRNGYDARYNIKNNIEAAKGLVDKLAPQDKMAIATPDLKLILDFTTDKSLLKKTLDKLSSNPKSNLVVNRDYGTLMAVLEEMFDEKDVRPIVIFQTQAQELLLLKGEISKLDKNIKKIEEKFISLRGGERGYEFSDVIERIEKSRATIYSIIPSMRFVGLSREEQLKRARISIEEWMRRAVREQDPARISRAINEEQSNEIEYYLMGQTAMMQVAKMSGGYTEFLEKPEDAAKVYNTIFAVINNRYTIGYYSTNEAKNGKRRNVKIQVKGHPEYSILNRENYLPQK